MAAPSPWEAIIGQDDAIELLRRALRNGRLHHAYLFTGPAGVGKTMAAGAFAQALLCLQPTPEGVACGACLSCERLAGGTHPDFLRVEPEGKTIGVDPIRSLQRWTAMRSGLSARRVALLEPAEAMSTVAQNALLKTLEEPPGGAVLILISHVGEGVVPTLVSRSQRVRFHRVASPLLRELIEARRPEYREMSGLIAALADGRPAHALERDWEDVLARRDALIDIVSGWPARDPVPALKLAAQWERLSEEDWGLSLDLLQFWMRDLLVMQEVPEVDREVLINGDRLSDLQRVASRWDRRRLLDAQRAFMQARRRMSQRVNKRLNFDVLLLQISQP